MMKLLPFLSSISSIPTKNPQSNPMKKTSTRAVYFDAFQYDSTMQEMYLFSKTGNEIRQSLSKLLAESEVDVSGWLTELQKLCTLREVPVQEVIEAGEDIAKHAEYGTSVLNSAAAPKSSVGLRGLEKDLASIRELASNISREQRFMKDAKRVVDNIDQTQTFKLNYAGLTAFGF